MVIVDTSAWITFLRRDGDALVKLTVKALLDEYEATLCGPVEMEFLGGAFPQERPKLERWFEIVPYLSNDQKIWRNAARNYSKLRAVGVTVPWNDVLIATLTIERGCRVYSVDKHFVTMAEHLPLSLYEAGYNGGFKPE